jgi:hypothetical protein|tara:strand:+ start:366 stop:470 length:105 start_codon:yes stop_codon:yes gene_type:complete
MDKKIEQQYIALAKGKQDIDVLNKKMEDDKVATE